MTNNGSEGQRQLDDDEITVLVCDSRRSASKRIVAKEDGVPKIEGFNAGALFGVMRKPVRDIRELSEILLAAEPIPNALVIRGQPKATLSLNGGVRRIKDNFETPAKGRRWVLIDFDKIPLPKGLTVTTDAEAVAEHLILLLPTEFHDASYHYQLSSSAGLKDSDVASMHVWFWLTRPWHDKELKRWGKEVNRRACRKIVDVALFNDVQPHYVAAPVFEGMDDPFPIRSALVVKAKDEVDLQPIEELQKADRTAERSDGGEKSPGFEALLDLIGDHPGGEGFHEPIIRAIASYVGTHGRDGTDVEWLYETVRKRVLDADRSQHDDDAYLERMASREHIIGAIEGALEKYGEPDPMRKARLVTGMIAHRGEGDEDPKTAQARLEQVLRTVVKLRQ